MTVMRMEAGLDTGPMLLKVTTPIGADDTGGSLQLRQLDHFDGPGAVGQAADEAALLERGDQAVDA